VTEGPFRGLVNDTLEKTKAKVYQIEAPSRHGSSGSPVANADGQVVGVLYASDDHNLSLAVSLPTLKDFLAHLGSATKNTANCPAQG
jgi:S1-C subfamily serine protease